MSDSSPLTKSISLCPPATRMVVILVTSCRMDRTKRMRAASKSIRSLLYRLYVMVTGPWRAMTP